MASKRNDPQPSSPPLLNDNDEYIHSYQNPSIHSPASPMITAGLPRVRHAIRTGEDNDHDLRSAVMDIAKNRNVRMSASGPGWIMATGMGMIRFLGKISGQNISMVLDQNNISGPQTDL